MLQRSFLEPDPIRRANLLVAGLSFSFNVNELNGAGESWRENEIGKAMSKLLQRAKNRRRVGDRMKLHLRVLRIGGVERRLVTLRPRLGVRFSTNRFHETWHILSDGLGAKLLGRLLWGLAFQKQDNTAILIHGDHLQATPFYAERSDPILLTTDQHSSLNPASLRVLKQQLETLGPPQKTIRWHTFSLDDAVRDYLIQRDNVPVQEVSDSVYWQDFKSLWQAEKMRRIGGFVCYSAPPPVLRLTAVMLQMMDPSNRFGMDYTYLASQRCWPDGEVQVFEDYNERCAAAILARKMVTNQGRVQDRAELYAQIDNRREWILRCQKRAQRKRMGSLIQEQD